MFTIELACFLKHCIEVLKKRITLVTPLLVTHGMTLRIFLMRWLH